ncbi:MAG: hypothetical protein QXH91_06320 [Candidatus Bathyarchaeia archaeon]
MPFRGALVFFSIWWYKPKTIIDKVANEKGVNIINKVQFIELTSLKNDQGVGAIWIDVLEDINESFRAKSIFLCTGSITRLYPVFWIAY